MAVAMKEDYQRVRSKQKKGVRELVQKNRKRLKKRNKRC